MEIERSKRDALTGLTGRGVYYQTLEKRIAEGQPVSVISIDMAFLKLFDKEGGKETGDIAIMTAGRILDFVAREAAASGIPVEAHRVGGDEFALSVGSADPKVLDALTRKIRVEQARVGKIPAFEGALQTYPPEALQFNIGIASAASPDDLRATFAKKGIQTPPEADPTSERRFMADTLNQLADKEIEGEKIIRRFAFLLTRSLELQRASDEERPAKQMALKTLMAYSEKSIFGEEGKRRMAQWIPRLLKRERTVAELIQKEILPFVTQQLEMKGKAAFEVSTDLQHGVETDIRLSLNELQIAELEEELEHLAKKLGAEHERVADLRKALVSAKAEKEEIAGLREQITKAA